MGDLELCVISLKYSNEVRPGRVCVQYNSPDETEWSLQESEFYEFYINRELAKLPPNTKYNVSYCSMKSQNINYFLFAEGCFKSVYFVLGKSIMYWQAENGTGETETLHGAKLFERDIAGEVGIEQIEEILNSILI